LIEHTIFGFLNVDKPLGLTSHDVVARVRRKLKMKKVGHAGTLDPLATGVLVICLGRATRLSEYAMASTKSYRAVVHFGIKTATYDAEGEILETHEAGYITRDMVEQILPRFMGDIEQLPPMYSAIKQDGKKLYELARAGQMVERKPRPVRIESLEIKDWASPQFTLDVTCGSGTYIRSLAHDIGDALGVGAYLAGLIRTQSGVFSLDNAVSLSDFLDDPDWQRHLLPPDVTLTHFPAIHLNDVDADHIRHGRRILPVESLEADFARAYAPDGTFMALLRKTDGSEWRPYKVFMV
jgi:tRNA pseudouridine55 synthase